MIYLNIYLIVCLHLFVFLHKRLILANDNVLNNKTKVPIDIDFITATMAISINDSEEYNIGTKWIIDLMFKVSWQDPHFTVRHSEDDNITNFQLDKILWTPKIYIENEMKKIELKENDNVKMLKNGKVVLFSGFKFDVQCSSQLERSPFGPQFCWLLFTCRNCIENNLKLLTNKSTTQYTLVKEFPGIDLYHVEVKSCSIDYEEWIESCLKLEWVIVRDWAVYMSQVFIPSFISMGLAWLSLFLHPGESATPRAIMLSTSIVILCFISEPSKSLIHNTVLERWITVCEILLLVCFLEFVVVNRLSSKIQSKSLHVNNSNNRSSSALPSATRDRGVNIKVLKMSQIDEWHVVIDILFRINFPLVFIVFVIRYYYTYIKQIDNLPLDLKNDQSIFDAKIYID